MPTTLTATNRLIVSGKDARNAEIVLTELQGPDGALAVERDERSTPLPDDLGRLLQAVLQSVAEGRTITVSAMPSELTTSSAAALIGVSRPTLMRMIAEGEIEAHKVGTHTRLSTDDVRTFIAARQLRQRSAFDELRDFLDD